MNNAADNPSDTLPDTLYAAPLSLYSGKARAYMDWKGLNYREKLSRPEVYRDIIIPAVGYPVIPVVQLADGTVIQDTTKIIDHYEGQSDSASVYPVTPAQRLVALLFESFGDEWLTIPAMHYRWNYNEQWVYSEFGKVALPDGTPEEQFAAGEKSGRAFKGFCPVLGITDATIPAIEASYEALLSELDAHFAAYDYLLGSRPSIGDYGLIGPLYAHLYRDPASGEIMERIAPKVAAWVRRMVEAEAPLSGAFLSDDQIPATLEPVLRRMMAEHLPWLQNSANMLTDWAAQNAGAELPRAVGFAPFTLGGVSGEGVSGEGVSGARAATLVSLWMHQRAMACYEALEGAAKADADTLLERVGGQVFQDFAMPVRLDFSGTKLELAQ